MRIFESSGVQAQACREDPNGRPRGRTNAAVAAAAGDGGAQASPRRKSSFIFFCVPRENVSPFFHSTGPDKSGHHKVTTGSGATYPRQVWIRLRAQALFESRMTMR